MSRLSDKLQKAAGAAARASARIEARADALIAREEAASSREDEVFVPHEQVFSEAEKAMDGVERALQLMSNGDPLEQRAGSQASPPPVPSASPEVGQSEAVTFPQDH